MIASNGPGSVSTYEVGKMLETVGLSIADVDIKILPFTQMPIAFANKAIDAAIVIPPFTSQFRELGHAVPFLDADEIVRPAPITISVNIINTDWAKANPNWRATTSPPICAACATTAKPITAARSASR